MTTQYTPTLKLALPVTGELSGTWGDVVNDNITSMIEQAIAGLSTINTWTANAHTLTTANGTTSESRCAMLVAATGSGGTAITGAGEIICPASAKLYVLQNTTSFAVTLKTSAGTGVAVAAGNTAFLFCDGTNVNSCVTTIVDGNITGNLTVGGNATINGNTTLGNATSDTITATGRFNTDLLPSTDNARDLGSAANAWKDLYIDGTAYLALVDINGGTIDGVSIGASTAATIINVDNLRLDGNTLSSTDTNGNVVIAPNGTGDVQLDADTVRVGDSGAAAVLTSNGAGALTVTTGGAADLTLSTNAGTDSGTVVIANGANGNITLTPNGTGDVILSADRTQIGDLNTDTTLTTNGTGSLNLTTNNGTNSGTIQIAQGVNGNITLTPNGTGSVSVPKLVVSTATATRVPYISTGGLVVDSANLTFNGTDLTVSGAVNAGSINATTLDLTNLEVTNIKAKDGTASITLADSTGVASFTANPVLSGGTANGVAYLNGSKVLTTGSALTFDGTNLGVLAGSVTTPAAKIHAVGNIRASTGTGTVYSQLASDGVYSTGTDLYLLAPAGKFMSFYADNSEQMRLTSTGLGIGTSSPAEKLHVNSGTGNVPALFESTDPIAVVQFKDNNSTLFNAVGVQTNSLIFYSADNINMRLDSSGNLGLAIAPSAWGSPYKAIQVGYAALSNPTGTFDSLNLTANLWNDGTNWRFIESQQANRCSTIDGDWSWQFANGSGGAVASLSTQMVLDATGRLILGASSWTGGKFLVVGGSASPYLGTAWQGSNATAIRLSSGGTPVTGDTTGISISVGGNAEAYIGAVQNSSNYADIVFQTFNGSYGERARISSAGVFQAGTIQVTGSAVGAFSASKWFIQQEDGDTVRSYACGTDTSTYARWEHYTAKSNGTPVLTQRWSANGSVQVNNVGIGFAAPTTDGMGITFPATQSASSGANTLDDYEQGTWTPTVVGGSTAGTTTYLSQFGDYVKIGRSVTVRLKVSYTAATGTGFLSIQGLPFAGASGESIGSVMMDNLNAPNSGTYSLYNFQTSSTLEIYSSTDDAALVIFQLSDESATIWGSITYFAAD
jgi:hypothetical protein